VPSDVAGQWYPGDLRDIDCTNSKISLLGNVAEGVTCRKGPSEPGDNGRCNYDRFSIRGTKAGIYFESFLFIMAPVRRHCWAHRQRPDLFDSLARKDTWVVNNNGQDFSELRTFGDGYSRSFSTNGTKCIAFYQPGPIHEGGVFYTHRGFLCGVSAAFGDVQLSEHIKGFQIR
jgi:hypothetical protein